MVKKPLPAPLLAPVLAWCAGIGLAKFVAIPFWLMACTGIMLLAAGFFIKGSRTPLILLLCLVLGALRSGRFQPAFGAGQGV